MSRDNKYSCLGVYIHVSQYYYNIYIKRNSTFIFFIEHNIKRTKFLIKLKIHSLILPDKRSLYTVANDVRIILNIVVYYGKNLIHKSSSRN